MAEAVAASLLEPGGDPSNDPASLTSHPNAASSGLAHVAALSLGTLPRSPSPGLGLVVDGPPLRLAFAPYPSGSHDHLPQVAVGDDFSTPPAPPLPSPTPTPVVVSSPASLSLPSAESTEADHMGE